jgi:very-short-patch-repair endonuclease
MSRDAKKRDRARQLRRELTPAERILWREVRNRRFAGFKFRRQHPIGSFFADFACCECWLIVELDGETHLGREDRDEERTRFLQAQGWLVLRFWNTQVYEELEDVSEAIYRACVGRIRGRGEKCGAPNPSPPEYRGRGE